MDLPLDWDSSKKSQFKFIVHGDQRAIIVLDLETYVTLFHSSLHIVEAITKPAEVAEVNTTPIILYV